MTRKATRKPSMEMHWRPLFRLTESGRLRHGKAMAKQGSMVRKLRTRDGWLQADVRSAQFGGGTYEVRLPCASWWRLYEDDIATWFSRRPVWLASWLTGEWPDEFLEFAESAGLRLFPDEADAVRMRDEAHCSCSDTEPLCKHVIAAVYHLVWKMEEDPLTAFESVGLEHGDLLDRIHARTREMTPHGPVAPASDADVSASVGLTLWPAEVAVLSQAADARTVLGSGDRTRSRWQCIAADLDPDKVAHWRRYTAWK